MWRQTLQRIWVGSKSLCRFAHRRSVAKHVARNAGVSTVKRRSLGDFIKLLRNQVHRPSLAGREIHHKPATGTSKMCVPRAKFVRARKLQDIASSVGLMLTIGGTAVATVTLVAEDGDGSSESSSVADFFVRTKDKVLGFFHKFAEPSRSELLPPPLPKEYQPPLTLVLDLNDTLVHSEWTRETGWRTKKRPGVDYFLTYLAQFYEIVVWSHEMGALATPVLDKLDPHGVIQYRLFKDATRYEDGVHLKDLTHLNRSLDKVVVIDHDSRVVKTHPDNAILIPKWDGKGDADSDNALLELIPFLEFLAREAAGETLENVRDAIRVEARKPDFPHGFNLRLRASMEEQRKITEKLTRSGMYVQQAPLPEMYVPPSAARASKQELKKAGPPPLAELRPKQEEAGEEPKPKSIWKQWRTRGQQREQQTHEHQERFRTEREEMEKKRTERNPK